MKKNKKISQRNMNVVLEAQGLISLKTQTVKPKKGKGSFTRKIKHKKNY